MWRQVIHGLLSECGKGCYFLRKVGWYGKDCWQLAQQGLLMLGHSKDCCHLYSKDCLWLVRKGLLTVGMANIAGIDTAGIAGGWHGKDCWQLVYPKDCWQLVQQGLLAVGMARIVDSWYGKNC